MVPFSEDKTVLRFLSLRLLTVGILHNGDAGQKTEDSFVLRNWYRFFPQKMVFRASFLSKVLSRVSEHTL